MTICELPSAVALVFPGQGAQRPGMGRDFYAQFAVSREAFAEASDALGFDVARVCFGDDSRLDETEFTQPCIVATEIAMLRALTAHFGLEAAYFGGHSLGEYAALCAAGVISLADAVRLTRRRGALMQTAVPKGEGAMIAVLAEGIGDVDLQALLSALGVDVANRNSGDQIVISGRASAVAAAASALEQMLHGVEHRLVALNVSAPFHSRLMRGVEVEFERVLWSAAPAMRPDGASRCTSNVTGRYHESSAASIIDALTRQISMPVDWVGNMNALCEVAGRIYEIGPSRPLTAFFKSAGRVVTPIVSVRNAQRELCAAGPSAHREPRSLSTQPPAVEL